MHQLRSRHVALVLSAAAIAVAGCGSSSKTTAAPTPATPTSTGTTTTPTATTASSQAELVKLVAPACRAFAASYTPAVQSKNAAQASAAIDQFVAKLQSVKPPASLQPKYQQLLSELSKLSSAFKSQDAAQAKQAAAQIKLLGGELGLKGCGGA